MDDAPVVLEVRGLTKRFPGVLANDHIDLKLHKGEVLGLLGENGAGKSTLMNLIYGLYAPDEGQILVNGQEVHIKDPNDAIRLGIGMVHQHFQLVPVLTVTENIMLGDESTKSLQTLLDSINPVKVFSRGEKTKQLPAETEKWKRDDEKPATLKSLLESVNPAKIFSRRENPPQPANPAVEEAIAFIGKAFRWLVNLVLFPFSVLFAIIARLLDRNAARQRILDIAKQYGLSVDPDALVQDLPVGVQQRVEIIKALYRKADILILDEPSAVLTPQETEGLFEIMKLLNEQGVSIIFISHKLKEVLAICDDITVLRLGKVAGHADPKQATEASLASMMVGREVILQVDKEPANPGEPILIIDKLTVRDDRKLTAVRDLSLEVCAGEIVGIAGVQGNGQTELVEAITGLREVVIGTIVINGHDVTNERPRRITETGVAHVPEDRQKNGMVMSFPVKDNTVLQTYYIGPFSIGILANDRAIASNAQRVIKEYDVRTPSIFVNIGTLSGGNQQKVIVGREFSRESKLLIVAQPTRGLDVGSIEFIHKQIVRMRDEGTAVLLVSTELDEILSLSDRIAVMYAGEIIDTLPIEQAERETIGLLMAGVKPEAAQEKAVSHG